MQPLPTRYALRILIFAEDSIILSEHADHIDNCIAQPIGNKYILVAYANKSIQQLCTFGDALAQSLALMAITDVGYAFLLYLTHLGAYLVALALEYILNGSHGL